MNYEGHILSFFSSELRLFSERVSLQNVFSWFFYLNWLVSSIYKLFCTLLYQSFLRQLSCLGNVLLVQCLVVQNVLHKVNGIFRVLKKLFEWWCNHIRFSRYNDFRTLIYARSNWPSRRTFGPKGQFFPIFLGFSEKKYPSVVCQKKLTFRAEKTVLLGKMTQKDSLL